MSVVLYMTLALHCTDREQITKAKQPDDIAPLKTLDLENLETGNVERPKQQGGKRGRRETGDREEDGIK